MGSSSSTESNIISQTKEEKKEEEIKEEIKDGLLIDTKEINTSDNKESIKESIKEEKELKILSYTYLITIDKVNKCVFDVENDAIQYVLNYSIEYTTQPGNYYLVQVIDDDVDGDIYHVMKPSNLYIFNYEILISSVRILRIPKMGY